MGDLGLALEDGAHQPRQMTVDVRDLLELVQHEHDPPLPVGAQLSRQLEQPLQRRVDVRAAVPDVEPEGHGGVVGVERDARRDP